MTARVLLIDDHQIMREGLSLLLEKQADLQVVGDAFDSDAGWQAVVDLAPDLVVMDLDIPGEGGTALTARIKASYPEIKIVVLTAHIDAEHIRGALQAGTDGYVVKGNSAPDLLRAVKAVLEGKNYLCPEASTAVVQELRESGTAGNKQLLSARELEVLKRIAEGHSTKEIAFELDVSGKTIETHRINLMTKLSLNSVAGLTKYALREGLTTL